MTDQHRRNLLNCYGNGVVHTPAVSRLAAEGSVFDHAYTTQPVCTPARASLQTGLFPCTHGMQSNLFCPGCIVHELPDRPELLSRRLKDAGYSVGHTGKWHLGYGADAYDDPWFAEHDIESCVFNLRLPEAYRKASSLPSDLGYEGDDFPGHGGGGHGYRQYQAYLDQNGLEHRIENRHRGSGEVVSEPESTIDHFLADRAIHWIDEFRRRPQPFFFALHFWGPHEPAYVPSRFLDPYRELPLQPWPNFLDNRTRKPAIHDVTRHAGTDAGWAFHERSIRSHMAYGDFIDHQIGRVLGHLDRTGLYDNTIVIFAADHGDALGCHGGLVNKGYHFYEETVAIPLVIKPAHNNTAAGRVRALVSLTDIYSTILDAAGVPDGASRRHGRSLLPLVRGEQPPDWPDVVSVECTSVAYLQFSQRMIRRGDVKYVWNCGDVDELYDLSADPYELVNLAFDAARCELLDSMRRALVDRLEWLDDPIIRYHRGTFRGS